MFAWWERVPKKTVDTPLGACEVAQDDDKLGSRYHFEPVERVIPFSWTTRFYKADTPVLPYMGLVCDISGSMNTVLPESSIPKLLPRESDASRTRYAAALEFKKALVSNPFFEKVPEVDLSGFVTVTAFATTAKELMSAGVHLMTPNGQVMYESETYKGEDGKHYFKETNEPVSSVILDMSHPENGGVWKRQLGNREKFRDNLVPTDPTTVMEFDGFGDLIKKRLSARSVIGSLSHDTNAAMGFKTAMQSYAESFITSDGDMLLNIKPKGATEVVQCPLFPITTIISDGQFTDTMYDDPFVRQSAWMIECNKDTYFLAPGILVLVGDDGIDGNAQKYKALTTLHIKCWDDLTAIVEKLQDTCQTIFTEMTQRLVLKNDGDTILQVKLWGSLKGEETTWDVFVKPRSTLVVPWMKEGGPVEYKIIEESASLLERSTRLNTEFSRNAPKSRYRRAGTRIR
jgi:hypothetical protein